MQPAISFLHKVIDLIINPLIVLLFAVAMVVFLYGVFEYIRGAESEDAREKGSRHILSGVFGLFIMISVFGIINIIVNTFGINRNESGLTEILPR